MSRVATFTLFLFSLFCAGTSGAATTAELDNARTNALAFLLGQQRGDGSWRSAPGLEVQTTAHAVDALANAGIDYGYSYAGAVGWLANAEPRSTDSLARQIMALNTAGANTADKVGALLALRNALAFNVGITGATGPSWGAYAHYQGSFPDTSLAMEALLLTNTSYSDTSRTLGYMASKQNTDGGWAYLKIDPAAAPSHLIPTAHTVLTLSRYRAIGWGVGTNITNGITWLTAPGRQKADGGFAEEPSATSGSAYETALVYLAIRQAQIAGNAAAVAAQPMLDAAYGFLVNAQLPDGSWAGGVLPTALALRALPATVMIDTDNDAVPNAVELVLGMDPNTPDARSLARGNGEAVSGKTVAALAANFTTGQVQRHTLADTGGGGPFVWRLLSGSLPDGVVLNVNTGEIAGIPTTAGTFNFIYQVNDSGGGNAVIANQIVVANAAPVNSYDEDVPTLPEWGIILMGLLLLASGAGMAARTGATHSTV